MKAVASLSGIDSISMDMKEMELTAVGVVDPIDVVAKLRKYGHAWILSIESLAKEGKKKEGGGGGGGGAGDAKKEGGGGEKKKDPNEQLKEFVGANQGVDPCLMKIVLKLDLHDDKDKRKVLKTVFSLSGIGSIGMDMKEMKRKVLKTVSSLSGIDSIGMDMKEMKLTVVGVLDPIELVTKLRKYWPAELLSVGPLAKGKTKEGGGGGGGSGVAKEGGCSGGELKDPNEHINELVRAYRAYNPVLVRAYRAYNSELFEPTIEPPGNISGVDDAVIYGRGDDKKNLLLLSDDCKGLDISLIQGTSETTSKVGDTVIYGRKDDKKKVINLLLSDDCGELDISLIQITGAGGIGKSTLAYLVYSDSLICDYFDIKAWVYMPESIDIGRILKAIIESLTGISCLVTELNELKQIIREELSGKRFLIVLDNFRNGTQSFWGNLMVSLSIGAKGSIVMVTTRTEIICDLMLSNRHYHLKSLSDEHCFSIFLEYAFDKQEPCIFPELMRTGKRIVAKCEGIPLAAKAVGSLLHFNENNFPVENRYWKDVLESALWESDECFPALCLCYDYLPIHMKLCFRYCSLFPEGYIFEKDHLVRLWMSQGYLESTGGEAAEDIGINCFEELLRRSFFQCLHIYDAREGKYGIHDLFHNYAQRVAVECLKMEDSKLSHIPGNISHISLVPCAVEAVESNYLFEQESDLCSFLIIPRSASKWPGSAVHIENIIVLDDLFIKSRYLRSLDLSNTDIKELPDSIVSLKSLCYLSLNNTNIRRLPYSICSLDSLQTLELQDCYFLSDLPPNIKELTKLRCLNVFKESGFISMPSGIGELRNLRTLSNFNVGKVGWHCGIVELQNLLDLRGSLYISGLENVVNGAQAKQANLKMKGCLKALALDWFQHGWELDIETEQNALDVIQCLQPHTNLEELIIHGYFGDQFPTWLGDPLFCNLVSLTLDNCYESNVLPPLGQLPSLRFLSLQKMDSVRILGFEFCGSCSEVPCGFPSLEILNLWEMSELEEWNWVRDGDFPQLRRLSISMCFKLRKLPPLNHLRELVLHCCHRLPEIPRLKSLEYLKIDGFQKLEFLSLPDDLPALKKLEINNCGRLSRLVGMSQLVSVEQLKVSKCPQIHLNDQWPDNNQA